MSRQCVALNTYLAHLQPLLAQDGVTEVCCNAPGEVWVEQHRRFECVSMPHLNLAWLQAFAKLCAEYNGQPLSCAQPILSGSLPSGERLELIIPPACEQDKVVFALRKPSTRPLHLTDFAMAPIAASKEEETTQNPSVHLVQLIKQAVYQRKTILISGGTGTGKSSFLNACIQAIPQHERLVSIEDNREVRFVQKNHVHLLATRGSVSAASLFESALRLRPDRIVLAEIRGQEVFAFLEAINSGHPGSLSTIHGDSPSAALFQLYRKMRRFGDKAEQKEVFAYLRSIIKLVVQLQRSPVTGTPQVVQVCPLS